MPVDPQTESKSAGDDVAGDDADGDDADGDDAAGDDAAGEDYAVSTSKGSSAISMSKDESSGSSAPMRQAQIGESSTTSVAISTNPGGKGIEAFVTEAELFLQDVKTGKRSFETLQELKTAMESLPKPKDKSDAELDDERRIWAGAQEEFVKMYSESREAYKELTRDVRQECKGILEAYNQANISKAILHQEPSSRTKEVTQVQQKALKEARNLRSKRSSANPVSQIYGRMMDLAGIRILVYFPDDVSEVVRLIEESMTLDIQDAVVSYSRNRVDYREKDKSDQLKGAPSGAPPHKGASTDEGNESVKETSGSNDSERPVSAQVSDPKGKRPAVEPPSPQGVRDNIFEFPEDKVAEIQIMTVVMHAWSQLEHDVIYKNPFRLDINNTTARMLDAVNGLSINSEIILDELKQTLNQAQEEAENRDNTQFNQESLPRFLQQEYLTDSDDWKADSQWVTVLSSIASTGDELSPGHEIATPTKLRSFVTKNGILNSYPKKLGKQDIAIIILKALSVQFRERGVPLFLKRHWGQYRAEDEGKMNSLYKCVLACNAFSMMVVADRPTAIDKFKERFPKDIDNLRLINAIILLGIREPVDANTTGKLLEFANNFLETEKHHFAVALANLWVCIDIPGHGLSPHTAPGRIKLGQHGEFQCVLYRPKRVGFERAFMPAGWLTTVNDSHEQTLVVSRHLTDYALGILLNQISGYLRDGSGKTLDHHMINDARVRVGPGIGYGLGLVGP